MPETISLANYPETMMSNAETLYGQVKTAADQVNLTQIELAETETVKVPFAKEATIAYNLGEHKKAYTSALLISGLYFNKNFSDEYVKQAASLALQDGVEINL